MKIALGTAQFDKNYGVNRLNKKFNFIDKKNLVEFVKKNKITTIDTANAYKNAEKDLGKIGVRKFKIITKIPKLKNQKEINKQITLATIKSLKKLKLRKVYGLLIHNLGDLNGPSRSKYIDALKNLKKKNFTKKIGISLYDVNDLKKIIKFWVPDIIQVPYNILDRRLNNNSIMKIIKKNKIEIHIRSIFLQGLLTKKNNQKKFKKWKLLFNKWFFWCKKNDVEPFQAAYLFVKNNINIHKIIIGAENIKQIQKIINIKKKIKKFPNLNCKDKMLLNPSNWEIL